MRLVGLGLVEIQLHRSKLLERFHGCAHRLVPVPAIFSALGIPKTVPGIVPGTSGNRCVPAIPCSHSSFPYQFVVNF